MPRRTTLDAVRAWRPNDLDPQGEDKRALLDYLLAHARGIEHAVPIRKVATEADFTRRFSREAIQQQLIVPLRDEGRAFIGTSNRGIYLLEKAENADATISFYTTRIRSELKHLRNVTSLARRHKLFAGFTSATRSGVESLIYFDESGTPSLTDMATAPLFIMCGILIEDRRLLRTLPRRFGFIAESIGKPRDFEFRSGSLSKKHYERVLKEMAVVDFQWAAVCFVKRRLRGPGFRHAKTFYKYASQFLVGDLLNISWGASLYFDEYGRSQSAFDREFQAYLKKQNSGLPRTRLKSIAMLKSDKEPLIQLADLIAGVIKNAAKGSFDLLHLIDEKMIGLTIWPPASS